MHIFRKRIVPTKATSLHGIGGKEAIPQPAGSGTIAGNADNAAPAHATNGVLEFLKQKQVLFTLVQHEEAFSSQLVAKEAHVSGNTLGKAVLVELTQQNLERETVMCVLRAPDHVILPDIAAATDALEARILTEAEVQACTEATELAVEAGAVPPIPQLFKCRCFMDTHLAADAVIYFNAGQHKLLVSMAMPSYQSLVHPTVLPFAEEIDHYIRNVKTMLTRTGFPVSYKVVRHVPVVSAAATARALAVPGRAVAKAVAVALDGKPALCALCSHHAVDLEKLRAAAGAKEVALATPEEVRDWFPGVQEGAIPPFGHLFQMPLYLDNALGTWPDPASAVIIFNAGSFTVAIRMAYQEYLRVVRAFQEPTIGDLAAAEPISARQHSTNGSSSPTAAKPQEDLPPPPQEPQE